MKKDGVWFKEMFRSINKSRKPELLIEANNRTKAFKEAHSVESGNLRQMADKGSSIKCFSALGERLSLSCLHLYAPASRKVYPERNIIHRVVG